MPIHKLLALNGTRKGGKALHESRTKPEVMYRKVTSGVKIVNDFNTLQSTELLIKTETKVVILTKRGRVKKG